VAIEADKWAGALGRLGFTTYTVAGSGPVDRTLPGLAIGAPDPPTTDEVVGALADADLVVVENLCSLPLNPAAASVVAAVLAGRPAVLHHHDLPWQRPWFADHGPPPDDRRWAQVTINELSRRQLAAHGITATTVYNSFDTGRPTAGDEGRRVELRSSLGLDDRSRVVLQPTRALPRKNIGAGLAAAEELGATYWLLGPAEDGYGPELDALVARATGPVRLGWPDGAPGGGVEAAYAASDVIALPSTWEGFGNPSVESAIHRRPLLIGPYPVAAELAAFGFRWFGLGELGALGRWLDDPDPALLDHNWAVANAHFSLRHLPRRLQPVLPAW
jgi:mannosylglucosylglycerate synthase